MARRSPMKLNPGEPGNYTALVRDAAAAQGVALVEVYNLASN